MTKRRSTHATTRIAGESVHLEGPERPWLEVNSLDDLFKHEAAIVDRINQTMNGGYLFMTNPLMLFADIGVVLSKRAREDLIRLEPRIGLESQVAYRALRSAKEQQNLRINLRGLLERKTP